MVQRGIPSADKVLPRRRIELHFTRQLPSPVGRYPVVEVQLVPRPVRLSFLCRRQGVVDRGKGVLSACEEWKDMYKKEEEGGCSWKMCFTDGPHVCVCLCICGFVGTATVSSAF